MNGPRPEKYCNLLDWRQEVRSPSLLLNTHTHTRTEMHKSTQQQQSCNLIPDMCVCVCVRERERERARKREKGCWRCTVLSSVMGSSILKYSERERERQRGEREIKWKQRESRERTLWDVFACVCVSTDCVCFSKTLVLKCSIHWLSAFRFLFC